MRAHRWTIIEQI